jgi:hypothetical protein
VRIVRTFKHFAYPMLALSSGISEKTTSAAKATPEGHWFATQSMVLDGCPMFALAYMGRKRSVPMLSPHVQTLWAY